MSTVVTDIVVSGTLIFPQTIPLARLLFFFLLFPNFKQYFIQVKKKISFFYNLGIQVYNIVPLDNTSNISFLVDLIVGHK